MRKARSRTDRSWRGDFRKGQLPRGVTDPVGPAGKRERRDTRRGLYLFTFWTRDGVRSVREVGLLRAGTVFAEVELNVNGSPTSLACSLESNPSEFWHPRSPGELQIVEVSEDGYRDLNIKTTIDPDLGKVNKNMTFVRSEVSRSLQTRLGFDGTLHVITLDSPKNFRPYYC